MSCSSPFSFFMPSIFMFCPLCSSSSLALRHYHSDRVRDYFQCTECDLVFVPPYQLPSVETEKREYDLHQNFFDDVRYKQFLQKLCHPMLSVLTPPCHGLDFGCGPTPLMERLFCEAGHTCQSYDPIYFPDDELLRKRYAFISVSEAAEHFHTPKLTFQILYDVLLPGGWLGIMTKRVIDAPRFATWHYKNDPTHVSFYSDKTFAFIAEAYGYSLHIVSSDVVLLQKQR